MSHHLSLLLLTPLAGAIALSLWRGRHAAVASRVALACAVASLIVAVPLWFTFDRESAAYQSVERVRVLPAIGLEYHIGIDGVSLLLVILTTLMVCVTMLLGAVSQDRVRDAWVLALEFGVLLACLALDLLLFLTGWTVALVAAHRVSGLARADSGSSWWSAGLSIVSGVALLVGIVGLFFASRQLTAQPSFDITAYQQLVFDAGTQRWVFLVFVVAFAACLALALPGVGALSHHRMTASMVGPVLVTAVVVKMGTYGLIRIGLPMLPDAARAFMPFTLGASGVAMVVAGAMALARRDWMRSIAYAGASQLAMIAFGAFASNPVGVTGSALHQFNHGITIGTLWLLAAAIRRQGHSLEAIPLWLRTFTVIVVFGAVGLPLLSGFVSSFLILQGALTVNMGWAVVTVGALTLGAAALVRTASDLTRGQVTVPASGPPREAVSTRRAEWIAFAPLAALTVGAGVYPRPLLERLTTGVDRVVARVAPEYGQHAIAECGAAPTPELAKTNAAAAFLEAVPCGPDGKPLEPMSSTSSATTPPPPAAEPQR